MSIIDIVIIVLIVLLLIVGLSRGLVKMLYGLVASVLALVLAVTLTSPIVKWSIDNTKLDDYLVTKISQPLSEKVPNINTYIFLYDLDGDASTADVLVYDSGNGIKPYASMFDGTSYKIIGKIAEPFLLKNIVDGESKTALSMITSILVAQIFMIIGFVVVWIVIKILLAIVFRLFRNLVSKAYVAHFIDKVLGGVFGLALALVIVFGVITIIQMLQGFTFMEPVINHIADSKGAKLIAENNFIFKLLDSKINIQEIIDKLMSILPKA